MKTDRSVFYAVYKNDELVHATGDQAGANWFIDHERKSSTLENNNRTKWEIVKYTVQLHFIILALEDSGKSDKVETVYTTEKK